MHAQCVIAADCKLNTLSSKSYSTLSLRAKTAVGSCLQVLTSTPRLCLDWDKTICVICFLLFFFNPQIAWDTINRLLFDCKDGSSRGGRPRRSGSVRTIECVCVWVCVSVFEWATLPVQSFLSYFGLLHCMALLFLKEEQNILKSSTNLNEWSHFVYSFILGDSPHKRTFT